MEIGREIIMLIEDIAKRVGEIKRLEMELADLLDERDNAYENDALTNVASLTEEVRKHNERMNQLDREVLMCAIMLADVYCEERDKANEEVTK